MLPNVQGGAIAQGSIFTYVEFAPSIIAAQQKAFPLTEELEGYRVEIVTSDGHLFHALPLSKVLVAVNVLMPSTVPVGEHSLTVIRNGERSPPQRIKVVRASPGLFTVTQYGRYALAGHDLARPVTPGDRITLWATGLGPIAGSDALPPPVGDLPTDLTVTIGNVEAEILYQGRAPCCAGLDQIDVLIPEDAPLGCFVPVWTTTYGSLYSNIASLAISESGEPCWRTGTALSKPFIDGPTGFAELSRQVDHDPDSEGIPDSGRIGFLAGTPEDPIESELWLGSDDPALLPPPGTCAPRSVPHGIPLNIGGLANDLESRWLDGGTTFLLEAPSGPSTLTRSAAPEGLAFGALGAQPPISLFPGSYRLEGEGGPGFPAFTSNFNLPPAPPWTNQGALPDFPRDQGIALEWQGGDSNSDLLATLRLDCPVLENGFPTCVFGSVFRAPPAFTCRATPGATSLEVPPAFYANETTTAARLQLTNLPRPAEMQFATDGPETGLVIVRDSESVPLHLDVPHLASTPVTLPDGSLVQAELAANSSERQRGLMFRPSLKPNGGMLFLFNQSARWSFWMFNTLIPLDIIWLNEDREIIFINPDTPPCPGQPCPVYGPNSVSRSVLELAAGEAARRNLQVGDQLDW